MTKPKPKPSYEASLLDYYPPLGPIGYRAHQARGSVPLFVQYPDGVHLWLSERKTRSEYHMDFYREMCPGVPIHTIGKPFQIVDNTKPKKRRRRLSK